MCGSKKNYIQEFVRLEELNPNENVAMLTFQQHAGIPSFPHGVSMLLPAVILQHKKISPFRSF
jgi:hypothetical protein